MGFSAVKQRRKSIEVQIGRVAVGGEQPIAVQSMTNTYTGDVEATARQGAELHRAGSKMVPPHGP